MFKRLWLLSCLVVFLSSCSGQIVDQIDSEPIVEKGIELVDQDKPRVLVPTEEMLKFKDEYMELNGNKLGESTYQELLLPEYNLVKYVTPEEVLELQKSGTGLIYFGSPACPWCRQMIPILIDAALDLGLEEIYYLDIRGIRTSWELQEGVPMKIQPGHDKYQDLLVAFQSVLETMEENPYHLIDDHLNELNTEELRIFVPLVVAVKDGEIVDYHYYTVEKFRAENGAEYLGESLSEPESIWLQRNYERVIRSVLPSTQSSGCDAPC